MIKLLYLYLVRRSPVSLKSPLFSWDVDVVMHALMNLWGEFTSCLLILSRQPPCCWYLLPKHGPMFSCLLTQSFIFADFCGLQIFVLIFSDNSSWCIALQTISSLSSQIYNNEGNFVRRESVPETSVYEAGLPRHLNGVCADSQTEQELPFFSSCSGDLNLVSSPFRQIWISFVIPFL